MKSKHLANQLVAWQLKHGRHDLPWQNTHDAYQIWLSEIMLQQTQVATVKNYYTRFLQRFPDVFSLAQSTQDEVLALWTGLGYYSRARNLHACAQAVVQDWNGVFPRLPEQLQTLKGIGASTAAAIAVFAYGHPAAILDGNVKRVLCRFFNVDAPPNAATDKILWALAKRELLTANEAISLGISHADGLRAHTQGLMDLGAGFCARIRPNCTACPLNQQCIAHQQNKTTELPRKKTKTAIREESWHFVIHRHQQQLWLEQRVGTGIWAKLYSFPHSAHIKNARITTSLPTIKHRLSHRLLTLSADVIELTNHQAQQLAHSNPQGIWLSQENIHTTGMPKPILNWAMDLLGFQKT